MAEPTILWNEAYPIADAENGKFVTLDMSTVNGHSALSANSGFRQYRYALLVKTIDSGAEIYTANTLWVGTSSVGLSSLYSPNVSSLGISELEIQNTTGGTIYFLASSTTYANVVANGFEIANGGVYYFQKQISSFSIASLSAGKLRLFGYYKN